MMASGCRHIRFKYKKVSAKAVGLSRACSLGRRGSTRFRIADSSVPSARLGLVVGEQSGSQAQRAAASGPPRKRKVRRQAEWQAETRDPEASAAANHFGKSFVGLAASSRPRLSPHRTRRCVGVVNFPGAFPARRPTLAFAMLASTRRLPVRQPPNAPAYRQRATLGSPLHLLLIPRGTKQLYNNYSRLHSSVG